MPKPRYQCIMNVLASVVRLVLNVPLSTTDQLLFPV